jgi:hypothetical protein
MDASTNFDYIFVIFSSLILLGSFGLQRSLGDVIADEAELSTSQKDEGQKAERKKMTFLKKRK